MASLDGRRVVVVDDQSVQAAALALLLRLEGAAATHEVVAAAALGKLQVDPPDVVVIDVKMPGLTGPAFLEKLRATHPGLPAVLLTGYPRDDPRLGGAMHAGRVAYLAKPVELQDLVDAIGALLGPPPLPSAPVGAIEWSR